MIAANPDAPLTSPGCIDLFSDIKTPTPNTVLGDKFLAIDDRGEVRAAIGTSEGDSFAMLFDSRGRLRVSMILSRSNDTPQISLMGSKGSVQIEACGGLPSIELVNSRNEPVTVTEMHADGQAVQAFFGADGKPFAILPDDAVNGSSQHEPRPNPWIVAGVVGLGVLAASVAINLAIIALCT